MKRTTRLPVRAFAAVPLGLFGLVAAGAPALETWKPDPATGTSLAVIVPERAALIHTAQLFPINRRGRTPSGAARQTEQVLKNLDALLQSAGSDLEHIVRLHVYLAEPDAMPTVQQVFARRFAGAHKPAASFVVGALPERDALLALDAVALVSRTNAAATPRSRKTKPPAAAASENRFAVLPPVSKLYVSGMADPDALLPAARKTLEKLTNAIGYFGLGREHVIQLKVFFQPMREASAVRRVIADFFDQRPPPVVLVEWLSANPAVEIELIATIPPGTPHAAVAGADPDALRPVGFFTPPGTTDSPVFRRVARVNRGRLIYTSGLYGWKATDAAGQVREIFATLGEIVNSHNSDFEHLVKATYYVTDEEAGRQLNVIRPEFYHPKRAPAASKALVRGVGPPGKTVMVDMIAVTQ